MNIYLMGYMGCGKTRTGRELAAHSGRGFLDLDTLFEETYHTRIPDFFRQYGEAAFREKESALLKKTAKRKRCIIALGGGTPCFNGNMDWLKSHGFSVYLQLSVESLTQRLQKQEKQKRPLLSGLSADEVRNHILNHLKERENYYLQADCIWPGENVSVPELWQCLALHIAAREKTE